MLGVLAGFFVVWCIILVGWFMGRSLGDASHVAPLLIFQLAFFTPMFPTAQNVFVAASRYQTGLTVAKDTVLITTVVAVPAMIGVALLLS